MFCCRGVSECLKMSAGQSTTTQSQQHNLALLHSLLSQAQSAGMPAAAGTPGMFSAGQPGQPQLPASNIRPPGQPQWPVAGLTRTGQIQVAMQGMSQPGQHGRPSLPLSSAGGALTHVQPTLPSAPKPGMSALVQAAPGQAMGAQTPQQPQHPGQTSGLATSSAPQSSGQ